MANDPTIDTESPQESSQIAEIRAAASVLLERVQFMRQAGISFKGDRDLYDVLGYDRIITNVQYRDRYARGGIAGRVVDALPNATWRGGWELIEDEDPKKSTEFEKAWDALEVRLKIGSVLRRVDILAGLSTFAVLLIGASGELDTELPKAKKPEDLLFLQPFAGGGGPNMAKRTATLDADASIHTYETDPNNERFAQPLTYQLKRLDIINPNFQKPVHWTRIIHIAENILDDDIYGQPSLERVWNLLDDLDKVTGGGAEAFWLRANQGLHLNVDKDMQIGAGNIEKFKADLKAEVDDYRHKVDRFIQTRGVEVNTLGSDVANFSNPADAILTQIAGSKAIPKRILTGSEMGELASSQDRDNWKDQVNGRQTMYAAPCIVRPLVDRLIKYGYLPTPKVKNKGPLAYEVKWAHIQTLTEDEKSKGALTWAQTLTTEGPVFNRDEIRDKWYGMEAIPKADLNKQTGEHTSPETGLPLDPTHDPTTGLPLKKAPADTVQVDPLTGLPVKVNVDTGMPAHVQEDAAAKARKEREAKLLKFVKKPRAAEMLEPDLDMRVLAFNKSQVRDKDGKWTAIGSVAHAEHALDAILGGPKASRAIRKRATLDVLKTVPTADLEHAVKAYKIIQGPNPKPFSGMALARVEEELASRLKAGAALADRAELPNAYYDYIETIDPDWQVLREGLTRTFALDNRRECASFIAALMQDANINNHHPDIETIPDGVMVTYTTHSAGDTVTALDYQSAARADRIFTTYRALTDGPHLYASTQIDLPKNVAQDVLDYSANFIPEEDLASDGRETNIHVTVKYGLHSDNPGAVRELVANVPPVSFTLGKTNFFRTDAYDVLFIEVESNDLYRLNKRISNSVEVTDTYPTYKPHVTIAYLKSGLGPSYAGSDRFAGRTIIADELVFAPSEGDKIALPISSTMPRAASLAESDVEILRVLDQAIASGNESVVEAITVRYLGEAKTKSAPTQMRMLASQIPAWQVRWCEARRDALEFTDRYEALGIPYPNVDTMCLGQCEGTGWLPLYDARGDNRSFSRSRVTPTSENDPTFTALWDAAEKVRPAEDGWHFVKCPLCQGTGLRPEIMKAAGGPGSGRYPKGSAADRMAHPSRYGHGPALRGTVGQFDPMSLYLDTPRARPSDRQLAKLHAAYTHIDKMLHDPDIGKQLWSTLQGMTPMSLRRQIASIEHGDPQTIYEGKGSVPLYGEGSLGHPAMLKSAALAQRMYMGMTLRDALREIADLMDDPEVGSEVELMVQKALEAGDWDALKTLGGHGSGNFGHSGREGKVGGSASGTGPHAEWKSEGGWEHTGINWKQPVDSNGRPIPIKVDDLDVAVALVKEGKVVELKDVATANTLVVKLAEMANDAKAKSKDGKAPDYDLCNVSVKGSNLFCAQSIRNAEFPEGIPRIKMPQLGGKAVPGSEADKLPHNAKDEVDGSQVFLNHLQSIGVKTSREEVPASHLKASQNELRGNTVGGMMTDPTYHPDKDAIFVSSDNYVIDGHHRWAAVVGRDAADGRLGDSKMKVIRVNAPATELLHIANAWSVNYGIAQAAGVVKQSKDAGILK